MASEAFAFTASAQSTFKRLHGWSVAENAGTPAAARVLVRDGGSSGTIVADVRLAASGSHSQGALDLASETTAGFYVEVNAGTVRGCLFGG